MEILNWFKKTYPELILKMKNTNHELSLSEPSPYHSEGDVWTHTLMVYNEVKRDTNIELKLSALLHDIGKPDTIIKQTHKDYYSFTGHEFLGCFLAIPILKKFEEDFKVKINKDLILKVINYHQDLFKLGTLDGKQMIFAPEEINYLNKKFNDLELYDILVKLSIADGNGRFCEDYTKLDAQADFYNNFIPEKPFYTIDDRPELIILAGPQGAGKTTIRESLMKGHTILSIDDIMMEENKKNVPYNMWFSEKRRAKAINILYDRLNKAISNRESIILDNVNIDELARRRQLRLVPDKYYFKRAINVISDIPTILKRNEDRKKIMRDIPVKTLEYAFKNFSFIGEDVHQSDVIIN